jgi:GNAT superfamily N-acetyltransferase
MAIILHLVRRLDDRPKSQPVAGVSLRAHRGTADIEPWLALRQRAFAEQALPVRPWTASDFHREFTSRDGWRPEWMWIAMADVEPPEALDFIGTASLLVRPTVAGPRAALHWLAVDSRWRNRGLGRMLVTAAEQAAWDAGHREMHAETHALWGDAVRLYQALGYRTTPR